MPRPQADSPGKADCEDVSSSLQSVLDRIARTGRRLLGVAGVRALILDETGTPRCELSAGLDHRDDPFAAACRAWDDLPKRVTARLLTEDDGATDIRFFAGAPLPLGRWTGYLLLFDAKDRDDLDDARLALEDVAAIAAAALLDTRQRREATGSGSLPLTHPEEDDTFRSLVDQSLVGIYIIQGGRFVYANPKFAEIFGYDVDELPALNVPDLVADEDKTRVLNNLQRRADGEVDDIRYSFRGRRKDGSKIYVQVHGTRMVFRGRPAVVGTLLDVTRTKVARQQVAQLKSFYEHILDAIPVQLAVFDREGRYEFVNPSGISDDEVRNKIIGRTDVEYFLDRGFDAELGQRRHQAIKDVVREKRLRRFEERIHTPEGVARYYIRELAPVLDAAGEVRSVIGYSLDVTELKETERALRESEERWRRLVAGHPDPIIISIDNKFVYVNQAAAYLLGAENPIELLGRSFFDFISAELEGTFAERVLAAGSGDTVDAYEHTLIRIDGEERIVETYAVPVVYQGNEAVQSVIRDITERRRAEKALRESEEQYRKFIEQSPNAVYVLQEDHYVLVNPVWERLFGYTAEEARAPSFTFWNVIAPESRPFIQERVRMDRQGTRVPTVFEFKGVTRDGQVRDIEATVAYITWNGRRAIQGIYRDVTEQKQHERHLIMAKERAEELNQLKSAFLANMSHEIRTPLTSIIGFSDVLAEEVNEENQEFAELIRRSGQRLMDTLNSVLDLAQLEGRTMQLDPEPLDVVEQVRDTLQLFRPQAEDRGLTLLIETETPAPIWARLDRSAFARVITNLVGNAVKFTLEGSVNVVLRTDRSHVDISVIDTGVGIAKTFVAHVFDEFKQESTGIARDYEGSGLGLTITKRLLDLMGGTIEVESEKGKGSTFTVRFPRMDESESTEAQQDEGYFPGLFPK